MRALIAEDDSISRRMLEAFLVKWGYEVMVATEGEEAWGNPARERLAPPRDS